MSIHVVWCESARERAWKKGERRGGLCTPHARTRKKNTDMLYTQTLYEAKFHPASSTRAATHVDSSGGGRRESVWPLCVQSLMKWCVYMCLSVALASACELDIGDINPSAQHETKELQLL